MEKILSIAIPAYNAEKFLSKCLDTLIDENIMHFLDVIIINDGSEDRTKDIAETYTNKYPETFRLISKTNGGHGSAVNRGIKEAWGKYFCVLDSDDWYDTNALVSLVTKLCRVNSDVCIINYRKVDEKTLKKKDFLLKNLLDSHEYQLKDIINQNIKLSMPNICYKMELLHTLNFSLQEKTYYVDEEFCVIPFSKVKTIYYVDVTLYNYLVGQSQQSMAIINQIKNLSHKKRVVLNLIEFYNKTTMEMNNKEYILKKISIIVVYIFTIAMIYNGKRKQGRLFCRQLVKEIKLMNREIYRRFRIKYYVYWLMSSFGVSIKLYEYIQAKRGN